MIYKKESGGQGEGVPVMKPDLNGIKVVFLGGDKREIIVAKEFAKLGAKVNVFGLSLEKEENIEPFLDVFEAFKGVNALILPVLGINPKGEIYGAYFKEPLLLTLDLLKLLPPKTPVFVGAANLSLKEMIAKADLKLIELMQLDEVAILNSIPSAEGALQLAMQETEITIHGSKSVVLGFGRTAMTLARMLNGLGAFTTVVARDFAQKARALEMGFEAISFNELNSNLKKAQIIFNTVPALVLGEKELNNLSLDALIIDIASFPGGVDFEIAKEKGIKAFLALGLPGKVAPKTSGMILAKVIPRILSENTF